MLEEIITGNNLDAIVRQALFEIHANGPSNPKTFEKLAYVKKFHGDFFGPFESTIVTLMGLFYKTRSPKSVLEEIYQIYAHSIRDEVGVTFTPPQASAYKEIGRNRYFSFSAPTSTGKSYLFREFIRKTKGDIVIVVPSRALIAEYYYDVLKLVDNSTLVLQFIDNINTDKVDRRVFVVTPERATELFKYRNDFNVELILLDEAQISEEQIRGITFDAFVRRADKAFPYAKKIFAHPFVDNPEAQLAKHGFDIDASAENYNFYSVGKIFLSVHEGSFEYFTPNAVCANIPAGEDIVHEVLSNGGSLLVYMAKSKIYDGDYLVDFSKYIDLCPKITNPQANKLIEELRAFIGASRGESEKRSTLINLLERGIVIHHGSMPLRARLIVEDFVKQKFARICFATSTLNQGINMPFDVVWIDNFTRMVPMTLKNLIGRSGRSTTRKGFFDYGYTVIKKSNVATFKSRFNEAVTLNPESALDMNILAIPEDSRDLVEAIKGDSYNTDLHLTNSQVERIEKANIDSEIKYILDNLLVENKPITGRAYYELKESIRKRVKECFKAVYVQHLRRTQLTKAEYAVLSASIPILLWHIQGKSFSEIVSLRHAFLSEKDKRRAILANLKAGNIDADTANRQTREIEIRFTPIPSHLPNTHLASLPLFRGGTSVVDIDYDLIVYDTYDYLDKVISLSLVDPLGAALEIYFKKSADQRARALGNYIRYGTNDEVEIWLIRYGFSYEDIQWIKEHITSVDEKKIDFKNTIYEVPEDKFSIVSRYV